MKRVIDNVMEFTTVKALVTLALGYVGVFIAPVQWFLIFTLCVLICDAYTGIRAAKKRGEKIRSKGLRKTTEKFVMYSIAILLAQATMMVFGLPERYFPLTYMASGWIAYHELRSNYENISEVTGVDLWTKLKAFISRIVESKK